MEFTTNTYLLNQIVIKSGKSKVYLASKLGLSRHGFYNKLEGKSEFFASEIALLCKELGLTPQQRDEIFFEENSELDSLF